MIWWIILAVFVILVVWQIAAGPRWVQYKNLKLGGNEVSWEQKYATQLTAWVGRTYHRRIRSKGGSTITTDYDPHRKL